MFWRVSKMRVAVFFGERFEEVEAITVVDFLKRAGYEVDTTSVSHTHHVRGSHGVEIKTDFTIDEIRVSTYDLIVLPGGPGFTNLEKCDILMKYVKRFPGEGKYVAAICAAPSILGRAGLLEGKKATCFPGYEKELKGATYTGNEAEADGNIITGKSAGAAVAFSLKIVETISGHEAAKSLSDAVYYNYYE